MAALGWIRNSRLARRGDAKAKSGDVASAVAQHIEKRLGTWRSSVLNTLALVVAAAAISLVAIDIRRAVRSPELWPAVSASALLYVLAACLAASRRLGSFTRAWGMVLVGYTAAALAFVRGGIMGEGQLLLLALPALGLIMVGSRSGLVMSAVSLVCVALFTALTGTTWGLGVVAGRVEVLLPADRIVNVVVFMTTLAGLVAMQWRSNQFYESIVLENVQLYRESERLKAFAENIVETMREGILIEDTEGAITFANSAATATLGYTQQELLGRHTVSLMQQARLPAPSQAPLADSEAGAKQYQAVICTTGGEAVPVIVSRSPLLKEGRQTGTLTVFADITDLTRAQDALRESERAARAILNATTESVMVVDGRGTIVDANGTAAERHGLRIEELVGANLADLLSADQLESRMSAIGEVVHSGNAARVEDEFSGTVSDNHYYPVWIQDSGASRVAIFSRDITLRRQAERRALRSERLAALGRLAGELAHEVNNPLQDVRGNMELLLAFDLERDEWRRRLSHSIEAIDHLTDVSRQMLEIGAPADDEWRLTSIDELLRKTLGMMRDSLQRANIRVTVDLPADPLLVRVAPSQMGHVLMNLTSNAMDAMTRGGRLRFSAYADDGMAVLKVSDDSPALGCDELQHMFDPFFTTETGHVGLGLAVSRDIIEQHHGAIRADNVDGGQGVVFTIKLPIAEVSREPEVVT